MKTRNVRRRQWARYFEQHIALAMRGSDTCFSGYGWNRWIRRPRMSRRSAKKTWRY